MHAQLRHSDASAKYCGSDKTVDEKCNVSCNTGFFMSDKNLPEIVCKQGTPNKNDGQWETFCKTGNI